MEIHQGRILKRLVKQSGLTQEEAGKRIGYSRPGFRALFKDEVLKDGLIDKACEVLDVAREVFFPSETVQLGGNATYNRPSQTGGIGNVQVVGTYQECMSELVAVQKELIAEKERTNQLQHEIIEMLKGRKK